MGNLKRNIIALAAAVLCFITCAVGAEAAGLSGLYYEAGNDLENPAVVKVQYTSGGYWLFLPSCADLNELTLRFDYDTAYISSARRGVSINSGEPFDFAALFDGEPENGVYTVYISSGRKYLSLNVMKSENLRSMFITSADSEKSRAWVEQNKENKAKDNPMVLLRADGSCVYDGILKNIKGRGNSTWAYPKKPYQIKLDEKIDLLDAGESPAGTWVLLANYTDSSLIRNALTYDLADSLELDYSPNCEMTDLYYDGEYRGTYLLSEKTEVGESRVQINDLDGDLEDANPDVEDFDALPTEISENENGNQYQYVTGLESPPEYSGGYLLEMDFEDRAKEEKSWFVTTNGKFMVCKSPEYATKDMAEYISGLYQEFEDAVYCGGVNAKTGKSFTEYMDLESLVKTYLISELSMDGDAYQSSTFFYKPENEDMLYAGPVWDFDSAYGKYENSNGNYTGLWAGNTGIGRRLLSIPEFREAVKKCYTEEVYPLIVDVLLDDDAEPGEGRLRSVADYISESAASREMNVRLWRESMSYDECAAQLKEFLSARSKWLYDEIMSWESDETFDGYYDDVDEDAWYHDAVCYVTGENLFSGTSEVLFSPDLKLSRAMAVTVLYRLDGRPVVNGEIEFDDVDKNAWYGDAVLWAAQNGISTGIGSGKFGANDNISREELVTLFYRYAKYSGVNTDAGEMPEEYVDAADVSEWAKDAFAWALNNEIINGTDAEVPTLSPHYDSSRAQAAVMFQRYSLIEADTDAVTEE